MPLQLTALYGALLALVGVVLASRVVMRRPKVKVSLRDAGDPALIEANRRHMNWVENVPLLIALMGVAELNGAPSSWLHALGGSAAHPVGDLRFDRHTALAVFRVRPLGQPL